MINPLQTRGDQAFDLPSSLALRWAGWAPLRSPLPRPAPPPRTRTIWRRDREDTEAESLFGQQSIWRDVRFLRRPCSTIFAWAINVRHFDREQSLRSPSLLETVHVA